MSLKSKIESLLFVAAKPLSARRLSDLTKKPKEEVEETLKSLSSDYAEKDTGLQFNNAGSRWEMVSHPDNARVIRDYLKDEQSGELTKPSLETLTIIAYRGLVTKAEIEKIRGVNCSLILRNLLIKGLIEANEDKKEMVTRYRITMDFMKFLGIKSISELPDFEKLNQDKNLDKLLHPVTSNSGDQPTGESIKY